MNQNPDFQQKYYSAIQADGLYKVGHDSIRLLKRLAYNDRSFFDNINYFDLMGSI